MLHTGAHVSNVIRRSSTHVHAKLFKPPSHALAFVCCRCRLLNCFEQTFIHMREFDVVTHCRALHEYLLDARQTVRVATLTSMLGKFAQALKRNAARIRHRLNIVCENEKKNIRFVKMPIPLSFAFWAMNATKRYHTTPVFERPMRLQNIYFARIGSYIIFASILSVNTFKAYFSDKDDAIRDKNRQIQQTVRRMLSVIYLQIYFFFDNLRQYPFLDPRFPFIQEHFRLFSHFAFGD